MAAVFDLVANPEARGKWDKNNENFRVISHDKAKDEMLVYFVIKTPKLISNRDYVAVRKIRKDFPKLGQ